MSVDVSVVIVSWNRCDRLERCLLALRADPSGGRREVIVVDNGSTDGSAELARERFPEVRVVELPRNVGFGPANNVAYRRARGAYLFLLNSDAYVQPGAVGALCRCLDAHPEAAVAGPQLRYPDGRLQPSGRAFPTFWTALRALLPGAPSIREPRDYAQSAEVDEVSAAAMLVRRAALLEGEPLFDPAFPFFGEDIDLCWRLRKRGWRTRYCPEAVVEHEWGASRVGLGRVRTALFAQRAYHTLLKRHRSGTEAAALRGLLLPITVLKAVRWSVEALRSGGLAEARQILALSRREWRRLARW